MANNKNNIEYDTAMIRWRDRLRGTLLHGRLLKMAHDRSDDLQAAGITPKMLSHPDAPALLEAILIMGGNINDWAADIWLTHQDPVDILSSVSSNAVGDILIDPVHDPPDPF